MNILVSVDSRYLKPLAVALYSLHKNTEADDICVYFVNVTLDNKELDWLERYLQKLGIFELRVISIEESIFAGVKVLTQFSIEAYSRLLLLKVLPDDIDRILWLDADIIIHNTIDILYNMNMDGHSLVACQDIRPDIGERRQDLGMADNQAYFNSGVVLFNLDYLRKHFNQEDFIEYAIKNTKIIKWPDQDVLNALCGKTAIILDRLIYNYTHFPTTIHKRNELLQIEENNSVLHYIGENKPWDYHFYGKTYKYWRDYAKESGVYSSVFWAERNIKNIIYHKLIKPMKKLSNRKPHGVT